MSKTTGTLDLTLNQRGPHQSLGSWLYGELRGAILEGRLSPGNRLPATRDFARLHSLSRGTVVSVFDRLRAEGYVASRVGSGTWVSHRMIADGSSRTKATRPPAFIRRVVSAYARPKAFVGLVASDRARPFECETRTWRSFQSSCGDNWWRGAPATSDHGPPARMMDAAIGRCARPLPSISDHPAACNVAVIRS